MSKARSPRYPVIGLKAAVEKVQMVYAKDYQNKIPKEVVVQHMGYGTLNGKSSSVLSALKKYGLLEESSSGISVSNTALAIIAHPSGAKERAVAIKEAAMRPPLFIAFENSFPGGKASDQALKSYLLTQRFLPRAVTPAIRAYRETMELVAEESAEILGNENLEDLEESKILPTTQGEQSKEFELELPQPSRALASHRMQQERIIDDAGNPIVIQFHGEVADMYDFLSEYIEFRKTRAKKSQLEKEKARVIGAKSGGNAERTIPKGIPFVTTNQQKVRLREMGYGDEEIDKMKPDEIQDHLGLK